MTKISVICAIDRKRGIGYKNKLLYEIPEDLKRFRQITSGHPVIMGYNTYRSIGRPLPNRTNIVLSKNIEEKIDGAFVFDDLVKAIAFAKTKDDKEVFVIGGASVYTQAINLADRLYLTIIDDEKPADTFFPEYSHFKKIVSDKSSSYEGIKFRYVVFEK